MHKFLKVDFKGWTATPRDPIVKIGTINTLFTPTYSMLIGLIECCVGNWINKEKLQIGFWYDYDIEYKDLETTKRLVRDIKTGKLSPNKEDSVTLRKSHTTPQLSLFINRPEYEYYFKSPVGIPCLGQSQDLIWINNVSIVDGVFKSNGLIKSGLIVLDDGLIPGEIIRCVNYYDENEIGKGRTARRFETFISVKTDPTEYQSKRTNIFHSDQLKYDVYIYEF